MSQVALFTEPHMQGAEIVSSWKKRIDKDPIIKIRNSPLFMVAHLAIGHRFQLCYRPDNLNLKSKAMPFVVSVCHD